MLHCQLVQFPSIVLYSFEWEANIGEGQGDTTASRPRTRDLHDGKKFLQLAIREAAEVNGKVPVGFVEHSRPSRPMEERASGVRGHKEIPTRIKQRIDPYRSLRQFTSLRLCSFNFSIGHHLAHSGWLLTGA